MADLVVKGGPSVANEAAAKRSRTITLTFTDDDAEIYDKIIADAKADRRSPSQFLVIFLSAAMSRVAIQ